MSCLKKFCGRGSLASGRSGHSHSTLHVCHLSSGLACEDAFIWCEARTKCLSQKVLISKSCKIVNLILILFSSNVFKWVMIFLQKQNLAGQRAVLLCVTPELKAKGDSTSLRTAQATQQNPVSNNKWHEGAGGRGRGREGGGGLDLRITVVPIIIDYLFTQFLTFQYESTQLREGKQGLSLYKTAQKDVAMGSSAP